MMVQTPIHPEHPAVDDALLAAALTLITGGFEAWLIRRSQGYLLHYQRKPYAEPPPYPARPPYEHPADMLAGAQEERWLCGRTRYGYTAPMLARLHDLAADYLAERLEELAAAPVWPRTNTPEGKAEERAWAQAALAKLLAEGASRAGELAGVLMEIDPRIEKPEREKPTAQEAAQKPEQTKWESDRF